MLFLLSIYLYGSLLLQFGKIERSYLDEADLFHIFTQAKQKNRGEERERERERERTIIHVFISIIHSKQLIL